MSDWIHRLGALFGGRVAATGVPAGRARAPAAALPMPAERTAAVPARAEAPAPAVIDPQEVPAAPAADPSLPFFEWLLGSATLPDAPLQPAEQRLLDRLDQVLGSDTSRAALLPRAPAVIPQLLNSLRDERQSTQALADRVAKDPHLVAEVIRLANSAQARAAAPVADLPQAIARVGTAGLRRVIASVVLKPMFDAQADLLSARAAPRLWLHSEAQAAECMRLAGTAGLDPFEGYLAGLMHNVGWSAALRAVDRSGVALPAQFSHAFVQAFEARRETFFALLVRHWQLTAALTALALELLDGGLAAAHSPLGQALRAAERSATLAMLTAPTPAEPAAAPA